MGTNSIRLALAAWILLELAATAVAPSTPEQGQGSPPGNPWSRRPRIRAELSERLDHPPLVACTERRAPAAPSGRRVRVATWNIRAALSAPVDDIAAELQAMQADVVALQEVDAGTRRGGFVDQPAELARAIGFHAVFAASIEWDEGHYGLAVLSRWPLAAVHCP